MMMIYYHQHDEVQRSKMSWVTTDQFQYIRSLFVPAIRAKHRACMGHCTIYIYHCLSITQTPKRQQVSQWRIGVSPSRPTEELMGFSLAMDPKWSANALR